MDRSLLEQPLVTAPATLQAVCLPEQAALLRALTPEAYWLAIASELSGSTPPTTALEGVLGDFRYFPKAKAT